MEVEENIKAVDLLRLIISSSIGPRGSLKLVHNNCGGHVVVTSLSSRLMKHLRFSNPILKVISSAAKLHLQNFANDGGSYFLLIICELLTNLWKLDIPQNCVAAIFTEVCQVLIHHLYNECSFKIKINFDNLKELVSILSTIINSKPGCQLSKSVRHHVVGLVLKAFLAGVSSPNKNIGFLHYTSICGLDPKESQLLPGLLFSENELGWSAVQRKLVDTNRDAKNIVCVLFRVSLSGDTDLTDGEWSVQGGKSTILRACTDQIMKLSQQIVKSDIKVVACQKVIHPQVKKYFNNNGIITLDRLGVLNFGALTNLTGAVPLETFNGPLDVSSCGKIHSMSLLSLHKQNYCHFLDLTQQTNVFVLCNFHEESLEELKTVCQQGVAALRALLHTPYMFLGAGCLEIHLTNFLKKSADSNLLEKILRCDVKKSHVLQVTLAIADAFQRVALHFEKVNLSELCVNLENQHFWIYDSNALRDKCGCGIKSLADRNDDLNDGCKMEPISKFEIDGEVKLDSFWVKFNALKSAFEVVATLMKVDGFIKV